MAKNVLVGKGAMFGIAATSVAPTNIAGCTGWTVNTTGDTHDATGMNNAGVRAFETTLTSWTISANGHWDENETAAYGGTNLFAVGTAVSLGLELEDGDQYAGRQDAVGTGEAFITAFNVTADMEGGVDWTMEAQGTGVLTLPGAADA